MNVPKLPTPEDMSKVAKKPIDQERESLKKKMMQWEGGRNSRISLYDFTHKVELIRELETVGWKNFNDIAVEPADLEQEYEGHLPSPVELYHALEKELAPAIQAEFTRLQKEVLPKTQTNPNHRVFYNFSGQHPFVTRYLVEALKGSGWWVDTLPATLTGEKQLVICPKALAFQTEEPPPPEQSSEASDSSEEPPKKPKRKGFFGF